MSNHDKQIEHEGVDPEIIKGFERIREARMKLILHYKKKRRKPYTKLDCVAREGSHSSSEVSLPYKDE